MNRIVASCTLMVVTALAVTTSSTLARSAPAKPFVDQRGTRFGLDDLRGAPLVLVFVSAHCTDICPILDAEIAVAADRARRDRAQTRFLTLTLDPERDSLADMRRIARRFGADPDQWRVADGSARAIHALMRRLEIRTERDKAGFARAHDVFVYIFDRNGRLERSLLPSTDLTAQLAHEVAL